MKIISLIFVILLILNQTIFSVNFVVYAYLIFYLVIIIINNKLKFIFDWYLLFFLLACSLSFIPNSINPIFNAYSKFIGFIFMLIFSSTLISNDYIRNHQLLFLNNYYRLSYFIVSISFLGYFFPVLEIFNVTDHAGGYRGVFTNSVFFGTFLALFMVILFYKILYSKVKYKFLSILFFLISFYLLFITGSRSAIISFLLVALFIVFKKYSLRYIFFKYWYYFFIIPSLVIFMYNKGVFDVIIRKVEIANDLGQNSRDSLWNNRISEFIQNPIFGIGFNTVNLDISHYEFKEESSSIEPGSSWLFILSTTGLLGFISFLFYLYKTMIPFKIGNENILYYSLTLFFLISMIFEGFVFSVGNILVFLFYISLTLIKKDYAINR